METKPKSELLEVLQQRICTDHGRRNLVNIVSGKHKRTHRPGGRCPAKLIGSIETALVFLYTIRQKIRAFIASKRRKRSCMSSTRSVRMYVSEHHVHVAGVHGDSRPLRLAVAVTINLQRKEEQHLPMCNMKTRTATRTPAEGAQENSCNTEQHYVASCTT